MEKAQIILDVARILISAATIVFIVCWWTRKKKRDK